VIYPPPGAGTTDAEEPPRRDADRQLALLLVTLSIGTATLFYAANLRVSRFVGTEFVDRLTNRIAPLEPVSPTLEIELDAATQVPLDPFSSGGESPEVAPTSVDIFGGAFATSAPPSIPSAYPEPLNRTPLSEPTRAPPTAAEPTPTRERATATVVEEGEEGAVATASVTPDSGPATPTVRPGYPDPGTTSP
jgi:hypothetical protein